MRLMERLITHTTIVSLQTSVSIHGLEQQSSSQSTHFTPLYAPHQRLHINIRQALYFSFHISS